MQSKNANSAPPTQQLTVGDIYHIVFKHKWLILILSTLGVGAAIAVFFAMPAPYISEARLHIRYVEDTKAATGPTADSQMRPVDSQGEGVLDSEANIITSLDVTGAAAEAVGFEKILGNQLSKTNRELAALIVRKGLEVHVPRRGNVITIAYSNPDITLVQPVLRKVIEAYYKKHVETHKNLGVLDEFLTEETDRLAQSLRQTEEELRALKTRAGVVSLDETRRSYAERYTRLREELDTAEAELSERVAALKELQNGSAAEAPVAAAGTNVVAEPVKAKIPPEIMMDYRRLSLRLDAALAEETELRRLWSPESPRIKDIKASIDSLVKQKNEMEAAHPRLVDEQIVARTQTADRRSVIDLPSENARVAALRARITTLTAQFNKIKADAGSVDEIETRYLELQRKKEQQELQYKYYSKNLDQARVNSQLGFGKLSNISEIQAPSLPLRDSKKLKKIMAGAAFGGVGAGLALAFLLEIVFRQSVRKPSELEKNFDLPVFLTIPELDGIGPGKPAPALPGNTTLALPEGLGARADSFQEGDLVERSGEEKSAEIARGEHQTIHPYAEALRDRLMSYFELKGLTHKPKLIALTSCSQGAGVTTLAAGLAASLSETGEGNVLLVDMNQERGAAHPFFRGRPACGIADVLDAEKRPGAQVNENLFVVHGTGGDDRLPKVLPKRLAHLLPKLHASDYDYIIFDMPPITQTSVTPRLAGFMDMVFLVVEGEKTNRNWVKHATGLLKQSKASVAAVFNKRRDYVPRWLHQEF